MNFLDFIERERNKINEKYLKKYFDNFLSRESEPDLQKILKSGKKFMLSGGRRLLPICLIQTFKGLACEKDLVQFSEEIYRSSLSVEMLHIASLIIEDIVDQESHREDSKTVQTLIRDIVKDEFPENLEEKTTVLENISNASTIYEGNILSLLGSQIISNCKFPKKRIRIALEIYQKGLIDVSRGRLLNEYYKMMDLKKISLETYLILAGLKRGSQRATAAGLGGAFGNARRSQWEPLMEAMNKIGIIEQLINDKHGVEEDIRSGQASVLPIIAYQTASPDQREALDNTLGNPLATEEEIEVVKAIYNQTNAFEFVHHYANSLKNDAYNKLTAVYPGLRQDVLDFYENLLTYIIS